MNRLILAILGIMTVLVLAVGGAVIFVVIDSGDGDGGDGQAQATDEPDGGDERATGELRLSGPEPITLDPHLTQDAGSALYIVEIFGGLLTLNPDLEIEADLAEEIPTGDNGLKVVNDDGTVTYTFNIRDDALFHDRKPVMADDVKFSIERAADPATLSLVAPFFLGDIVGVDEKLAGDASEVSGIEVVDSRTIAITIKKDVPSFLYKLTYPTAFVVDQDEVEGDPRNWTRRPNGTGPFKLEEWRFGEEITLEANERYHLGAPKVERVRYLLSGGGLTLYESNEVDVAGVGLNDLERVQDPADPLNAEYEFGSRLSLDYIGFNTNSPPFDDPKVREAFARAIDKEQIARAIFEDAIPVANSIVMPGLPSYDAENQAPEFDPDLARQLLEESSYGGPEALPEISIAESGTGATSGPGTQAIVEMWRQNLGVDVTIEQAETATFFQDVEQGIYQMFLLGWIMDYPDEDDILNIHFDSDSSSNNTKYSNPEVDDLLRRALTESDEQQRIDLYRQAERVVLEEVPWFPLFFDRFHVLIKPYVNDYLIPAGIVPRLRFVSIEGE